MTIPLIGNFRYISQSFGKNCRSETKDLHHVTKIMTKWGTNGHVEIGFDARAENNAESKIAEVSLGFKSSLTQLENFQIAAKAELQPRILENSLKIQVGIFFSTWIQFISRVVLIILVGGEPRDWNYFQF